jgi:hypothetical protein
MMMPLHLEISPLSTIDYTPEYTNILITTQNGWKINTMTQICNLRIILCNQLVRMVIVDAFTNSFDDLTLRTVSMEYNRILSRIHKHSQISTN